MPILCPTLQNQSRNYHILTHHHKLRSKVGSGSVKIEEYRWEAMPDNMFDEIALGFCSEVIAAGNVRTANGTCVIEGSGKQEEQREPHYDHPES